MLKIGEFAALSSISISMLRHYDKIGLLVPKYIEQPSGYRYYDQEQLLKANQIVSLKNMGFSLDEIKSILPLSKSEMNALLETKLDEKQRELQKIQNQIKQINLIMQMDETKEDYALSIIRKVMPPMWVVSLRDLIHTYPEEGQLWERLTLLCQEQQIKLSSKASSMAIYHGVNAKNGLLDVEVQLVLDQYYPAEKPLGVFQLPSVEIASVIFKGGYFQIGTINQLVAQWLEENHLSITANPFTIYHYSPGNCDSETAFVTELCFPITNKILKPY